MALFDKKNKEKKYQKKINNQQTQSKHEFAFFVTELSGLFNQNQFDLNDKELMHRIINVVKLRVDDTCILFDRDWHAQVQLLDVSKKKITVRVHTKQQNVTLQPSIKFLLPVLKREALSEAVYGLCEVGVTEILLMITDKSQQRLLTSKELDRLQKIVIAAAEQSKHFRYPLVKSAISMSEFVSTLPNGVAKIVFDEKGQSFFDLYAQVKGADLCLTVGPEGAFTQLELKILQECGFTSCALTATVLRSRQAAVLGCGLFRIKLKEQ